MRFFMLLAFFCAAFLVTGCSTTRTVVEDSRVPKSTIDRTAPEVVIDQFGDITFQGKRVAPKKIASAVASAGIPKKSKVRILVPENRDLDVMGRVAGYLHLAGYGSVFLTNPKASADIKPPASN